ncbi:MAG: tetratricopeptide repeat protein, partial [Cyanobacteria bacterium]|nr:tetratricopeptide repeat protein [Cyanobacteriota bacterium]
QEFDEALKIKPDDATTLIDRGTAFNELNKVDKAIADFSTVIKSSQQNYLAYNNRGVSYMRKGLYDKALSDLNQAMKINPEQPYPYLNAAGVALCEGKGGDMAEKLSSWYFKQDGKKNLSMHGAILGVFCFLQANKKAEAKKLLGTALARGDRFTWPYPVLQYLSGVGKVDKEKLFDASEDSAYDSTQAHCFIALNLIFNNEDWKSAKPNIDWVTKHGTRNSVEYWIVQSLIKKDRAARVKPQGVSAK